MQSLLLGVAMGLGAGLSPGPLLALVLTTSLRSGFAAGARVASVPLISDTPVVALSVLLVGSMPPEVLTVLGLGGGLYVIWLGVDTVRTALAGAPAGTGAEVTPARSLLRGVLVNVLSPHPWLFWVAVGGPILVRAWADGRVPAVAFLAGFYVLLVGSKIAVAGVVAMGGRRLSPRGLRAAHAVAGAMLLLAGAALLVESAGHLGG